MRKLKMAAKVWVASLALALACGLVGCSGTKQTDTQEAEEGASEQVAVAEEQEEEDTEEERSEHWYVVREHRENSYAFPGSDDSAETSAYIHDRLCERDEAGNLIKITNTETDTGLYGQISNETVVEITYDEQGWPLTKTKVASNETAVTEDGEEVEDPVVEQSEFTYEYDEDGRVISMHSSGALDMQIDDITYHDNGKVACFTTSSTGDWGDGRITNLYTNELSEDGSVTHYLEVTTDEEGNELSRREVSYDENGNVKSEVISGQEGDVAVGKKDHELEYDAKGNVTKDILNVTGDGETPQTRWLDDGQSRVSEIFMSDGTIKAAPITYDEEYNDVEGEYVTYEGPYSVTENTYRKDDKLKATTTTYYDGTGVSTKYRYSDGRVSKEINTGTDGSIQTYKYGYDDEGNVTSTKMEVTGRSEGLISSNSEREWMYVEEPSVFLKYFEDLLYW